MIDIPYIIKTYWRKQKGKSGKLWDAQSVAEMEGISVEDSISLFNYLSKKETLTDDQVISLDPKVNNTPFGVVISDNIGLPNLLDRKLGDITVKEFLSIKSV
jgi:hypothetical protein